MCLSVSISAHLPVYSFVYVGVCVSFFPRMCEWTCHVLGSLKWASQDTGLSLSFFIFYFSLWFAPVAGEKGDMSCHDPFHHCTHTSRISQTQSKEYKVTDRVILTTQGCVSQHTDVTFTHWQELCVTVCEDISRQMQIPYSHIQAIWGHRWLREIKLEHK